MVRNNDYMSMRVLSNTVYNDAALAGQVIICPGMIVARLINDCIVIFGDLLFL